MIKNRILKQTSENNNNLKQNPKHNFASNHSLEIFNSNTIYTFIPKNGCSTMRLSLAIANGCIKDTKEFNWIHNNNSTFIAPLKNLIMADYTFIILRCPFRRLASVYLDKIVDRDYEALNLYERTNRKTPLNEITFRKFIELISIPGVLRSNIHWRPQIDFLVYEQYDDYFSLEEFSKAILIIEEKSNIKIYDARNLTKHGSDQYKTVENISFADTPPIEILQMKEKGTLPSYKSLFDDEIISKITIKYKDDIDMYKKHCHENNLLFNIKLRGQSPP